MCNGVINGNVAIYSSLWDSYNISSSASDKILYLKSIGCIEQEEVLSLYIKRYQDVAEDEWFTVIQSVYMNGPIGLKVAMEFLNKDFTVFYSL